MRIGSFPNRRGNATFAALLFLISRNNMHSTLRRRTLALATVAGVLFFTGSAAFAQDNKTAIKVGVSVGNGEQIFEVVKKVLFDFDEPCRGEV